MDQRERERWPLALEIAKEHLKWCRSDSTRMLDTFRALGKTHLGLHGQRLLIRRSVRVAELASAWLELSAGRTRKASDPARPARRYTSTVERARDAGQHMAMYRMTNRFKEITPAI